MRVTLMGIGSRGDVQPLVALGVGLQRAGHPVRLVAGDEFEGLVTSAGLDFVGLGFPIQSAMAAHTSLFQFAHSITDKVLAACGDGQDAIVSTFLGVSTCQLARTRGFPFFYAAPIPGLLTGAFPNPLLPPLPLGPAYNRLTYRLADRVALKSYPYARELWVEPRPTYLCCFSPRVVPRPADWGTFAHVTGYWFLDRPADWQPPQGLVDFLEAGPRPVGIGFGSMLDHDPARLTGLVLDAVALSGQRAVLVSGWGALVERALPSSVTMVESIPYDWLFPRCAAVVHHGGAGTTALALRAGIPAVTVPFGMDQAFWGRRVKQLGAGLGPIPVRRLTAGRLAAAIQMAVTDEGLRAKAAGLGRLIQAEDGVGEAVRIIERAAG